ncbi:hypothetical protein D3C86_1269600 [compost metagenome]
MLAVHEGEDGGLGPPQPLFDDDAVSCHAVAPFEHAAIQRFERLFEGVGHHHALDVRQLVGLDDEPLGPPGMTDVGARLGGILEERVGGRGDAVAAHERLGEGLAALDDGRRRAGAEHWDAGFVKAVGQAVDERIRRPDDHQVDFEATGDRHQALEVVNLDAHVDAEGVGARVAGGTVDPLDARRSGEFPGERVFAPAPTHHEHPQRSGLEWSLPRHRLANSRSRYRIRSSRLRGSSARTIMDGTYGSLDFQTIDGSWKWPRFAGPRLVTVVMIPA